MKKLDLASREQTFIHQGIANSDAIEAYGKEKEQRRNVQYQRENDQSGLW